MAGQGNAGSIQRIANVHLMDQAGIWDIHLHGGRISAIVPAVAAAQPPDQMVHGEGAVVLDGQHGLALPALVEAHVHLDTALSAASGAHNRTGTLLEGIARWAAYKQGMSIADCRRRAEKVLGWYLARGVQHVRSHVDTTTPGLVGLQALLEIRHAWQDTITLQLVAFPQDGLLAQPEARGQLEQALARGADVVGAIPHVERCFEDGVASVRLAFDLAERHGALVDIHCDEIDDPGSRYLEVVAAETRKRGMAGRVTASHAVAMHLYPAAYAERLMAQLAESGVAVVANPLANLNLQGRFAGYPKPRGMTRVRELLAHGVPVAFGHDDLMDPWYPLGTAEMWDVVATGLLAAHMTTPEEIAAGIHRITSDAARALHLPDYGLAAGRPAHLIVVDAHDVFEAIRRRAVVRYGLHGGRLVNWAEPPSWMVQLPGVGQAAVDFRLSS